MKSSFSKQAEILLSNGYSPLPVIPGSKRPPMSEWQKHCSEPLNGDLRKYIIADQYGSSVACGYQNLVAIDIDTEDPDLVTLIDELLPKSIVGKKGQRGETRFFHSDKPVKPAKIKNNNKDKEMVLEVLAHGNQCVIPETIHPGTNLPYKWTTKRTLLDTSFNELTIITEQEVDHLLNRLRTVLGTEQQLFKTDSSSFGQTKSYSSNFRDRLIACAEGTLRRIVDNVSAMAPNSGRNDALFKGACSIGWAIPHGILSEQTVVSALLNAAENCGLVKDDGMQQCRSSINSGLNKAINDPLPDLGQNNAHLSRGKKSTDIGHISKNGEILGTLTQDSAASFFAEKFAGKLAYDCHRGSWYGFNDGHWKRDERKLSLNLVREACREIDNPNKPKIGTANAIKGVESLARSDPRLAVVSEHWDQHPLILGTPGVYVDLKTGERFEPDPTLFISQLTAVTPKKGTPVRWLKFLNEVMGGDQEQNRFLQQIAGYMTTGTTKEQCLFFCWGPGGTGKSTFVNTLQNIMGDYAIAAPMETFTASKMERHLTELAMLRGKRLVTSIETEQGRHWAESRIKQLTGGDRVSARFMRQDHFEYDPEFKIVIVGNHAPAITSCDTSMRRRFYVVPFERTPSNKDLDLPEKLREEYAQILNWALEGCMDWQANGLVVPEYVQIATDRYFEEQDIFQHFLDQECKVGADQLDTSERLFNAWKNYSLTIGEDPGSVRNFGSQLRRSGFSQCRVSSKGKQGRGWKGLKALI